jgi:hypothetical protein
VVYGKRNRNILLARYEKRLKKQIAQEMYHKFFGNKGLAIGVAALLFFGVSLLSDLHNITIQSLLIGLGLGILLAVFMSKLLYRVMFSEKR